MKDKSVKISSEKYQSLKNIAIQEGRKIKFLLDKAVEQYIKNRKAQ